MIVRRLIETALASLLATTPAFGQDSDRDGLPDATDTVPSVSYTPGFAATNCGAMDFDPSNDSDPECKARERVAGFLASQQGFVQKIAFSVVKNGKVHFADAFARNTSGQVIHDPGGIHRLFRIGSTTKSMTAVAAKVLEERAKLSLTDYVSDDDASRLTVGGKRTLRHLLSHQGAFKLDTGHLYLFGYPGTLQAFWKEKGDSVSPHYNSTNYGNLGGGHNYSAFNYSLAGAYLENRSGSSFADTLQNLVFDRVKMATATLDGARAKKAAIGGTVGVTRTSSMHLGPYINLVSPTDSYCADNFYSSNDIYGTSSYSQQSYQLDECSAAPRDPAGGVMASAVDMANFARGLLDSYHGRGGLLSKTGIRDLWKPTHDFGCTTNCTYQRYYATGFFVATPAGKPVIEVEHGGSRAGFHTVFVLRPEADTAVCILVNGHVNLSAMNKVAKTILDDFAKPLQGEVRAYGKGGPGTASGQQVCASINTSGTNQTSTTYANGQYAIQVTATTGMSVSGFELHCDGGQTVTTSILAADSAGKPGTLLATSSMQVGATRNWYATTFAKPVSIAKGQRFFLSFTNSAKSINASLKSGSKVAYFARPVNGAWFSASANWTYKIQCPTTTGAVPNLGAASTPLSE